MSRMLPICGKDAYISSLVLVGLAELKRARVGSLLLPLLLLLDTRPHRQRADERHTTYKRIPARARYGVSHRH